MATAYDTANIIIPQGGGYKAGSLYGWTPSSGSVVDFSVTRAGATATRVNSSGLIESVAANVPRWDWAEGGSCPSLLIEPQRTNLLLHSSDYTQVIWSKLGTGTGIAPAITTNASIAPDGTNTAQRVVFDASAASGDRSLLRQGSIPATSTTSKITFYAKSFDGTTQYVNGATGSTLGEFTIGADWQRFEFDASIGTTIAGIEVRNGTTTASSADILLWGFQLEDVDTYASSYIPTAGSTETRNADVISKTAIASLLGDSEGSMYAELMPFTISTIQLYNSASARVWAELDTNSNKVVINNGAGAVTLLNNSTTSPLNVYRKIAWSYAVNAFGMSVNGTDLNVTPTQGTFADGTLSEIRFDFGSPFYGRIRSLAIYDIALTQSERENLTT